MRSNTQLFILSVLLLLSGCAKTSMNVLQGGAVLDNADKLLGQLQTGGYVIYFRHAKTNWQQQDSDRKNLDNCESQRNLSLKGQEQSATIGRAFSAMQIPIALVLSSPYCRCLETGKLAFGDAIRTFDLKGLAETERQESTRRVNVLKNMLATTPPLGKNTILISHSYNIQNAANFHLNEGDALVVKPMEAQGFKVVAHITADEWMEMARTLNLHRNTLGGARPPISQK